MNLFKLFIFLLLILIIIIIKKGFDNRRPYAEKRIEKIGKNITIDQLNEEVMLKWPNCNK